MSAGINDKEFATLRAAAALQGYTVRRSHPADGPVVYLLQRFGLIQEKPVAALVEMFQPLVGNTAGASNTPPERGVV